jgi:hypothetical protein
VKLPDGAELCEKEKKKRRKKLYFGITLFKVKNYSYK